MGNYDLACLLCGGPLHGPRAWLSRVLLLALDGRRVRCGRYNGYGGFDAAGRASPPAFASSIDWDGAGLSRCGVVVHADCHACVRARAGLDLRCAHFDYAAIGANYGLPPDPTLYGRRRGWPQDVYSADAEPLPPTALESPRTDATAARRVLAMLGRLGIRPGDRPSPPLSATALPEDARRLGGDGQPWVVRRRRCLAARGCNSWVRADPGQTFAVPLAEAAPRLTALLRAASLMQVRRGVSYWSAARPGPD